MRKRVCFAGFATTDWGFGIAASALDSHRRHPIRYFMKQLIEQRNELYWSSSNGGGNDTVGEEFFESDSCFELKTLLFNTNTPRFSSFSHNIWRKCRHYNNKKGVSTLSQLLFNKKKKRYDQFSTKCFLNAMGHWEKRSAIYGHICILNQEWHEMFNWSSVE